MDETVSAEQRIKQLEERQELMTSTETLTEEEKQDLVKNLSVRDRLMRRQSKTRIKTVVKDDLGEFSIETRNLTTTEWDRAVALNEVLGSNKGDLKAYRKSLDDIREFLNGVTITQGIDWNLPEISDDIVIMTLTNTFLATTNATKEALANFRPV